MLKVMIKKIKDYLVDYLVEIKKMKMLEVMKKKEEVYLVQ